MSGVKGMQWGQRKQYVHRPRKPSKYLAAFAAGASKQLYAIWSEMNSRCFNKNAAPYHSYGALGITVCDAWRRGRPGDDGFFNFFQDVGNPPEGLSLDRVDNDGNYEPENVRWATRKEQALNRRTLAAGYSEESIMRTHIRKLPCA